MPGNGLSDGVAFGLTNGGNFGQINCRLSSHSAYSWRDCGMAVCGQSGSWPFDEREDSDESSAPIAPDILSWAGWRTRILRGACDANRERDASAPGSRPGAPRSSGRSESLWRLVVGHVSGNGLIQCALRVPIADIGSRHQQIDIALDQNGPAAPSCWHRKSCRESFWSLLRRSKTALPAAFRRDGLR